MLHRRSRYRLRKKLSFLKGKDSDEVDMSLSRTCSEDNLLQMESRNVEKGKLGFFEDDKC